MLGSNFALLVKSPGDDAQQLLTTRSRYVYHWVNLTLRANCGVFKLIISKFFLSFKSTKYFLTYSWVIRFSL